VSAPSNTPLRFQYRNAARCRWRAAQLVVAMARLRRRYPRVFNALVTVIAHADARTLDAVAELVDFALCAGADDLAPIALDDRAGMRRANR
jgi:hypothetical protein